MTSEKYFGIFEAIVVDNSSFFKTGKVKVRVSNFSNDKIAFLEKEYTVDKDCAFDIDAYIFSPIGGGINHGLAMRPKINSLGVVQFLNGDLKKPIWMGGLVSAIRDEKTYFKHLTFPNDNKDREGFNGLGVIDREKNVDDEDALVLRLKTKKPNGTKKDELDWNKTPSDSLLVIDKEKITLSRLSDWKEKDGEFTLNKYYEINLSDKDGIEIVAMNKEDTKKIKKSIIKMSSLGTTVRVQDDETKDMSEIVLYKDKIDTYVEKDKDFTITTQNKNQINLSSKDSNVMVSSDQVIVNAKTRVVLNAKEIALGDGKGYIVTTDSPFSITTQDGTVLKSKDSLRG